MSSVEPSAAIELAPIEDTSLLAFYRDMNLPERRTFAAFALPETRGRILHADG